ncbi:MAG: HEPN domain-containing protein [Candidatus Odinarchaeota archaeon]
MNLPENEAVTSSICFHCQQFVEKMLKAFLTLKKVDFGKTHNIEYLLKLCTQKDGDFEKITLPDLTIICC